MPIDFDQLEGAVHRWLVASSGLPPAKVIQSDQDGPRPTRPFIRYRVGDLDGIGQPAIVELQDLTRPNGEEIERRAVQDVEIVITVTAYTAGTVGSSTARALLSTVRASLGLDSHRETLAEGGLSVFNVGRVQNVPEVLETKPEGRAVLEVRTYARETASEFVGYIATAGMVDQTTTERPED